MKNIVAFIAGIVLIFGAITTPAFAEDIDLNDLEVQASQQAELIELMGNPPIPRPDYCPDAPNPCAGVEDQYINEGKPVEDPLIGEDGTFTDAAKAEQIDAIEKELDKAPRPNAENDFPQTPEEQIKELSDLIDSREGTSQPNRGKAPTERPMLPHTGN